MADAFENEELLDLAETIPEGIPGTLDDDDFQSLRAHLVRIGPDYCGASEIIRAFLNGRGFGISPAAARVAALEFGRQGCTLVGIERALAVAAQPN